MSAPTSIADDQVRSAFERWKNLEEEKARIADDLKELFGEQKAFGHDTKAMRAAFRLKVKMDEASPEDAEHEALVDTYLAALQTPRASRAYARENVEEFRPVTFGGAQQAKLVETVAAGMQTEIGRAALVAAVDIMVEREEAEENSPEVTNSENEAVPTDATAFPSVERVTPHRPGSADANTGGDHVTGSSIRAATTAEGRASAPSAKRSALRPHCLNPGEACGGWGSNHCHACKLAMKEKELA